MKCPHKNFKASVQVAHLTDVGKFSASIKIKCADCNADFKFVGISLGFMLNAPAMSPDGLEARLPIMPADQILAQVN